MSDFSPVLSIFKNVLNHQNFENANKLASKNFSKEQIADLQNAVLSFDRSFKMKNKESEIFKKADKFLKEKYEKRAFLQRF